MKWIRIPPPFYHVPTDTCSIFLSEEKKTPTKLHVTCIFKILTEEVVCTLTLNNETIQKPRETTKNSSEIVWITDNKVI